MANRTAIQWTDRSVNALVVTRGDGDDQQTGWFCVKLSPGCAHCLDATTPILMADWTTKPIGQLEVGEKIVGFPDNPGKGVRRVYEIATVERVWRTREQAVRITTGQSEVIASLDHPFLTHQSRPRWRKAGRMKIRSQVRRLEGRYASRLDALQMTQRQEYKWGYVTGVTAGDGTLRKPTAAPYNERQWYWRVSVLESDRAILDRLIYYLKTVIDLVIRPFDNGGGSSMLKVESRQRSAVLSISRIVEMYSTGEAPLEFARGWLAGIFDTDGSWSRSKRANALTITNTDPNIQLRVVQFGKLARFVFIPVLLKSGKPRDDNHKPKCDARLVGGIYAAQTFVSECAPALQRKRMAAYGTVIQPKEDPVLTLEYLGVRDLIDIQTSTRTFVADGLMTHNCYAAKMNGWRGVGLPFSMSSARELEPVFRVKALTSLLKSRKLWKIFPQDMTDHCLSVICCRDCDETWEDQLLADVITKCRKCGSLRLKQFWSSTWIQKVFDLYDELAQHGHILQTLTKRTERLLVELETWMRRHGRRMHHRVWMGFSAEDQTNLQKRWEDMAHVPNYAEGLLWVSLEPALAPMKLHDMLSGWECAECYFIFAEGGLEASVLSRCPRVCPYCTTQGKIRAIPKLGWAVIGGESGPGARGFEVGAVYDTIDIFEEAGVPLWVKQLGKNPYFKTPPRFDRWRKIAVDGEVWRPVLKHGKGGDPSEWDSRLRVLQLPVHQLPEVTK